MDGVLYDSMPGHAKAWKQMMAEHGIVTSEKEFYLYEGMTGAEVIDVIIKREYGRTATDEEKTGMYARKSDIFKSFGPKKPMKDADRMIRAFIRRGLPRVLVTGSAQDNLIKSLSDDYPGGFPENMKITANDVNNGKPDPEPYLKGATKAGVTPGEAMVVENAPLGVRAGKAAGCFTVAVTTGPVPRREFEKEGADLIFPSMGDFADWLEENLPAKSALADELDSVIESLSPPPATITVVTDSNVDSAVLPLFDGSETLAVANKITIPPGEDHKDIKSVVAIWNTLEEAGATRRSLVVNIGGGLVTDIGGFAAATYKRGIRTVNVPTTLLGAVDAATGGKTGMNFNGLKNEIGSFHHPSSVIISARPLATLSEKELLSGYAEMLKTGFIADANLYNSLLDVEGMISDEARLEGAMKRCVEIKEDVVAADPKENGLRKILNFGHTAGHAFESLSLSRPRHLAHGEAVAHGMLVELILSHMIMGFSSKELTKYAESVLKPFYPRVEMSCQDIPELISLMARDKKNAAAGHPNFTLLKNIGAPQIDCIPEIKDIEAALEIYRDMMC